MTDEEIAEDDTDFHVKIAVRVNPSADHDFPEFFVKQMEKQLSIDRLYLLDVIPYSDLRYSMELRNGVKSELQNQIAVMGFSESQSALLTEPQLSSVAQPLDLIGETAANLLLEKIKNPDAPDRTVVLDARINIRESTDVRPQQ